MNEAISGIVVASPSALPSLFTARPEARKRLRDFFSSHIRNRNTRRAYMEAVRQFAAFCAELGIAELEQVEPVHVAAFVERQLETNSRPTVKQRLAALRMLDGGRPGDGVESCTCRTRTEAHPEERLDAGVDAGGGPRAARFDRYRVCGRAAGSRPDRADGLYIRPGRGRA